MSVSTSELNELLYYNSRLSQSDDSGSNQKCPSSSRYKKYDESCFASSNSSESSSSSASSSYEESFLELYESMSSFSEKSSKSTPKTYKNSQEKSYRKYKNTEDIWNTSGRKNSALSYGLMSSYSKEPEPISNYRGESKSGLIKTGLLNRMNYYSSELTLKKINTFNNAFFTRIKMNFDDTMAKLVEEYLDNKTHKNRLNIINHINDLELKRIIKISEEDYI